MDRKNHKSGLTKAGHRRCGHNDIVYFAMGQAAYIMRTKSRQPGHQTHGHSKKGRIGYGICCRSTLIFWKVIQNEEGVKNMARQRNASTVYPRFSGRSLA